MTSCMRSVSVHLASSPKVSKRKICLPWATSAAWSARSSEPPQAATEATAAPAVMASQVRRIRGVAIFERSSPRWA